MADEQDINIDVGENEETEVEVTEAPKIESATEHVEAEPQESEQEQQVNSAQKRINQLTKKMRDAEKREQEAIRYAQQVHNEASQLKTRMKQLDTGYLEQFGRSLTVEAQQAEADLKRALEVGDSDKIVDAQKRLYEVGVRGQQYRQAQAHQEQAQWAAQQQAQQAQQVRQNPQAAHQQVRRPDPKAEQWAQKNEWFGQDEAMTFAAFGIHKKLVEDEGFDPNDDAYYTELDRRMSREFPQKLGSSKRPAQTVAGVSRSSNNSGRNRKVRLTPTQVTIAKKLGVPLEEYAKYVKD